MMDEQIRKVRELTFLLLRNEIFKILSWLVCILYFFDMIQNAITFEGFSLKKFSRTVF